MSPLVVALPVRVAGRRTASATKSSRLKPFAGMARSYRCRRTSKRDYLQFAARQRGVWTTGISYKNRIAPSTLNVGIAFSLGFVPQPARPDPSDRLQSVAILGQAPGPFCSGTPREYLVGALELSRPVASGFSAMPGSSRWRPHYDRRWRGVLRRWPAWSARPRRGSAPPRHCRGW